MAYNLKEVIKKESRLVSGHRMCAGCGAPTIIRNVLRSLKEEDNAVISVATGCLEVSTCIYPYTSWKNCSFIHTAFECAAATLSGAEKTYNALKKAGKLPQDKTTKFIAFGGDGGTLDIGFQSLSGAMERGHNITYICYDNGAYMNTGTQRSSSTPHFADTTTSPAGKVVPGKPQQRKDLTEIMVKHNVPYVAQTALIGNLKDIYEKSEKAIYTDGPCYISAFSPCPRGWGYPTDELASISKLAVDTCFWPMYEVVNGVYNITYKPSTKLPIQEFLKMQKRFKHLFIPGNEWMIEELQKEIDQKWDYLCLMEKITNKE
ncbi:MAG: thiamine pyrophosphate-dependent enzyme [Clostridia bacterium]